MDSKEINDLIEALRLDEIIEAESIPNLDLYMDQVITLFEGKLAHTKRNETDKLLTKTMINNYAKDKLLMPAKKKKYTREHIILMILLYEMKQVLTISDIKVLFGTIIKDDEVDTKKLEEIYHIYLTLKKEGVSDFKEQVDKISMSLEEQLSQSNLKISSEVINNDDDLNTNALLMVIILTQKANYYKRLAEKIIDNKIKKL